jgi:hypothetical protein
MTELARSQGRVLATTLLQLLVSGGLLWSVQVLVAPRWLVGSTAGMTTLFQVVVATIVALYVLILGSVFVIAEQTTKAYSPRAVPLLMIESRVQYQLVRALFLAVAALLLSGKIPDSGSHITHGLSAAASTVALATATLLPLSAAALAALAAGTIDASEFSRNFIFDNLVKEFEEGRESLVMYKLDVLGDMASRAVRERDRALLRTAVTGLGELQEIAYRRAHEGFRTRLVQRTVELLCEAATDAIDLEAPARMRRRLVDAMEEGAAAAADAGDADGARAFEDAYANFASADVG